MAQRPLSVEAAARRDVRALTAHGDSGLAKTYLLLARELDYRPPARDAAIAREMRLTYMALHELAPEKSKDDKADELSRRRESRMTGTDPS